MERLVVFLRDSLCFRSFNRQQSWSNNPTQSNSFRVIQKITQTEEDDDDQQVTEHGPQTPKQFQQAPVDQIRKLKVGGDRELVNRFKQGKNLNSKSI